MITKEQAMEASQFHYGNCTLTIGPKGGTKTTQMIWRRNGKTQTWKRSPEKFSVPIKYGLYFYGYIIDADDGRGSRDNFHTVDDCPIA
jgi:hypothetical protein